MTDKALIGYIFMMFLFMIVGGMGTKKIPAIQGLISSSHEFSKKDSIDPGDLEVKIGLLLPDAPEKDLLAQAAKEGAELAVMIANLSGGYRGKTFRLVIRTADGLWGAGSNESVKFVYEDEVIAIITAVDGRNAHLAEQVATKSQVVQLETRATDETLSQAFVPWFFRIVPNDNQQSQALIDEIFHIQGKRRVSVIYEDIYDHQKTAETFSKMAEKKGLKMEGMVAYNSKGSESYLPGLNKDVEAVVVSGSFSSANPVLEMIKNFYPEIQIFGMLSMTTDGTIGAGYSSGTEGGIFVGSRFCYTTQGQDFKNIFIEEYGYMPNPAASYAFDGINLVVEACRRVGPDREKIRDVLTQMKFTEGATGIIEFDEHGNRISSVFLVRMIKGHPVILHP
jgi:branched-chain amino acid transport system substrate-binding protein